MTKPRKHISKRLTLRKQYTVVKKVAEKQRKLKKEIRKMKKYGVVKKMPKSLGIPNSFPEKGKMLDEIEAAER